MEESRTVKSSPTIRLNRLSLPTLPGLDLHDSFFHIEMDDIVSPTETTVPRGPDTGESAAFFDLAPPLSTASHVKVEEVMKKLVSEEHLQFILGDHALFYRFSTFLNRYKSHLVPTLIRYLEMRKAMKSIEYANAIARTIRWPTHTDYSKFSRVQAACTDVRFEDYAARELLLLCSEALSAFVTYTLISVVTDFVGKDMTGQSVPIIQDLVGNLAEVFCLTDPSVHDNPIIFASEEFHRTTQYGTSYAIDRNCRFLQGPGTDKDCTLRLAKAISLGQESNELLLNYRRDGTPFINLLMFAPLFDDKGKVRYFIGAQVDVTGLVENGAGVESFRAFLQKDSQKDQKDPESKSGTQHGSQQNKNSWQASKLKETLLRLQELSMMFSQDESDIVNRNSRGGDDSTDASSVRSGVPTSVKNRGQTKRVIGEDEPVEGGLNFSHLNLTNGHNVNVSLPGIYKHYLLVRPYPSLQIIFVSPSLRLPGLLRTHLFSKLGGPTQTISALESAFRDGASVTAKVLWLPKNTAPGQLGRGPAEVKPRYIRCTPLLGSENRIGVWMAVLVPVDGDGYGGYGRKEHEMVDETEEERRRLGEPPSRAASVRDGEGDGEFGLRRTGHQRTGTATRMGRGDSESQLYAQYLRSSSSTGGSREENLTRRKNSLATID